MLYNKERTFSSLFFFGVCCLKWRHTHTHMRHLLTLSLRTEENVQTTKKLFERFLLFFLFCFLFMSSPKAANRDVPEKEHPGSQKTNFFHRGMRISSTSPPLAHRHHHHHQTWRHQDETEFFSLRISFMAQVESVFVFTTFERRPRPSS